MHAAQIVMLSNTGARCMSPLPSTVSHRTLFSIELCLAGPNSLVYTVSPPRTKSTSEYRPLLVHSVPPAMGRGHHTTVNFVRPLTAAWS